MSVLTPVSFYLNNEAGSVELYKYGFLSARAADFLKRYGPVETIPDELKEVFHELAELLRNLSVWAKFCFEETAGDNKLGKSPITFLELLFDKILGDRARWQISDYQSFEAVIAQPLATFGILAEGKKPGTEEIEKALAFTCYVSDYLLEVVRMRIHSFRPDD